jgi:diaminopimelate dehydrogenase
MTKAQRKSRDQKQRLAVIGCGRLGKACAREILADNGLSLAGLVRRPDSLNKGLPHPLTGIPAVSHVSELGNVDAALICVPTVHGLETARDLLQHRLPFVECADLHGQQFQQHKDEIDRLAKNHETSAIVGAGWDPGALSLFRALFTILIPKGQTKTSHRPGISLHHSAVARAIPGISKALSSELFESQGERKRYLYVELEEGANLEALKNKLYSEPMFLGEDLIVLPVESVDALEEEGRGIVMERRESVEKGHQVFLLEARLGETVLAAMMMVAAAKALPTLHHRAYSLFDLPTRVLWKGLPEQAEREWL